MATVELKSVRKTYAAGFEAVKGVSLKVPDGVLCVLVGPSGCGKSTLLRMVAGLETVTGGEVAIGGRRVNDVGPAERDIAMVFQTYALYPHMSVYENMAYGLRNRGIAKAEIDRRVRQAAATLELAALLERRPRELSGGQRQRVAMGRAIVRQPKAFLFDEPLSNLDAKLRGQMRVEIRRLQRSLGVTSLYVTHDQLEAMTLADLLVVMNHGQIEQVGKPLDLYDAPATTFVASFIGAPAMNLIPVRAEENALVFADNNRLFHADQTPASAVLGFRPEDAIVGDTDGHDAIRLPLFKVDALETVGAETYLYGQVGGSAAIVRMASRHSARPGEELMIAVPAEKLHHFDGNGNRLRPAGG